MKFIPYCLGLSVLSLGITAPGLQAQGQDISNEALLKRIEELEQRLKIAERKTETDHEAAAEKAKTAASVTAGSSGVQIQSADKNFTLGLHAHVQADGRFFPNGTSTTDDTFLMRRVRPIIEGTIFQKLDYRLMLDFGSGLTANASNIGFVQDAYFNAKLLPEFQIQAGKFKEPVGLERLQSDADYLFTERSYPTQLAPNRDVGVQVQGNLGEGLFSYAVGVFNGVADGGSGDVDTSDDDKDVAGRIFAEPFIQTSIEPLRKLGFGIGGTYGHHAGPLRGYTSPGQQTIFSYYSGSGTNAVTTGSGSITRLAPQAYYYYGPFGVLAEYTISSSEATRTGGGVTAERRLEHTGWQVALSYFLTGEENGFKNPLPLNPVNFHGGGWGAWELVGRVSGLKVDPDTFPFFADPRNNASEAFSYGVGVNWHLNKNFKLTLDYEHTNFKGGTSHPLLARDEEAIMTRAQISF